MAVSVRWATTSATLQCGAGVGAASHRTRASAASSSAPGAAERRVGACRCGRLERCETCVRVRRSSGSRGSGGSSRSRRSGGSRGSRRSCRSRGSGRSRRSGGSRGSCGSGGACSRAGLAGWAVRAICARPISTTASHSKRRSLRRRPEIDDAGAKDDSGRQPRRCEIYARPLCWSAVSIRSFKRIQASVGRAGRESTPAAHSGTS